MLHSTSVCSLLLLLHLYSGVEALSEFKCNRTKERISGGTALKCAFDKNESLSAYDFPQDLSELEIIAGKELRLDTEVFAKLRFLQFVKIANVKVVSVQMHTFANIPCADVNKLGFEFEDGENLALEGKSWSNVSCPITVTIRRFKKVTIQKQAFSFLDECVISHVANLELHEEAFSIERRRTNKDEEAFSIERRRTNKDIITSIVFDHVQLETLAAKTFPSAAQEVKIRHSNITTVKGNAFYATELGHVSLENTTIQKVESNSFSERTRLNTFTLDRVRINKMESRAVVSGVTKLIIVYSRFETLHTGSFDATVPNATITGNYFSRVHKKAITLKHWNRLIIEDNDFRKLDMDAFSFQGESINKTQIITFSGNNLNNISRNAFNFKVNNGLDSTIQNNTFNKCECGMSSHIKSLIKPHEQGVKLFKTGYCDLQSECLGLPAGLYSVSNISEQICPKEVNLCEQEQSDAAVPPQLPGISSAVDIIFENSVAWNRRILGSVFIIVSSAMIVMMILSAVMWIGKNGYCSKARILLSTNSFINYLTRFFSGNGMTPTGSAHSISRLSIHEYAELQRKIGEAKEEEEIPTDDKATQTLPEELTQELLQSLQEKLNDPENYSKARNMIEHLYDLIKVEESCNKNYKDSTSINLDDLDRDNENVYDVIVQKRKTSSRGKKETVSRGTRAPSPDKLMPYTVYGETLKLQPAVCDYMEPKDQQVHTYTELPNRTPGVPNSIVCDYGEPTDTKVHFYTELPAIVKMANRPLPSKPVDGGQSTS